MGKCIRRVDAKARVTLFTDFAGCTVNIERIGEDEIRVRKGRLRKRRYSLAQLVAGINKKNRHGEISTGPPVGAEVW